MRRLSSWFVSITLALGVALGACTHPVTKFQEDEAKQRAETHERALRRRAAIRQTALPPTYRQQIDADFVRTLKDPDSRKVVYLGNPYGSLVCGTINARNSFGGYTGQQLFAAYFTPTGTIAEVLVFTPADIASIRKLIAGNWGSTEHFLQAMLYTDCGGTT